MQTRKFSATARKFSKLQDFAVIVQTCGDSEISKALLSLQCDPDFSGTGWQKSFNNLADIFATKKAKYTIFAKGNSKLPFYSFSTLPGVTCPGAGDCLAFCYSFTSWRFPDSFARQCQNAYLIRFGTDSIISEFMTLPDNVTLRLYVDGDFSSVNDVTFWFNALNTRKDIQAYGYSKSFKQILEYTGTLPTNYILNISGGHNATNNIVALVSELSITRGEFVAVNIGRKVKSTEHGTHSINKLVRDNIDKKVFVCPGKCGTCTGKGHACGMPALKGITIAIAMH